LKLSRISSADGFTKQRSNREADLVVGVEQDTTMRDRIHRANHTSTRPGGDPEQVLVQQEIVREFSPGDFDLDDLAQAIRQLLDPDTRDLHSADHRATHVMGRKAT
jgi:hypothetical protein